PECDDLFDQVQGHRSAAHPGKGQHRTGPQSGGMDAARRSYSAGNHASSAAAAGHHSAGAANTAAASYGSAGPAAPAATCIPATDAGAAAYAAATELVRGRLQAEPLWPQLFARSRRKHRENSEGKRCICPFLSEDGSEVRIDQPKTTDACSYRR